jgi:hypothetical protein
MHHLRLLREYAAITGIGASQRALRVHDPIFQAIPAA